MSDHATPRDAAAADRDAADRDAAPRGAAAARGAEAHYFAELAAGRFRIQRCGGCGAAIFYPRLVCPHCGGDRLDWFAPCGRAVVYSTTTVRRRAEQGGDYNVALVDLEEGPRMMTTIVEIAPEAVRIGMAVRFHSIAPAPENAGGGAAVRFAPAPAL